MARCDRIREVMQPGSRGPSGQFVVLAMVRSIRKGKETQRGGKHKGSHPFPSPCQANSSPDGSHCHVAYESLSDLINVTLLACCQV
jgi:hypothetical protein